MGYNEIVPVLCPHFLTTSAVIAGDLQWRTVFIYLNKVGQVTVRLQSKHLRGALTKNKKSEFNDISLISSIFWFAVTTDLSFSRPHPPLV